MFQAKYILKMCENGYLFSVHISNVSLDCLLLHTDENLYPFGFSVGDSRLFRTDDGSSSAISLLPRFRFFGASQSILYVSLILLLHKR